MEQRRRTRENYREPPDETPVFCPVCRGQLTVYDSVFYAAGRVLGCSECLQAQNAMEWWDEQQERPTLSP